MISKSILNPFKEQPRIYISKIKGNESPTTLIKKVEVSADVSGNKYFTVLAHISKITYSLYKVFPYEFPLFLLEKYISSQACPNQSCMRAIGNDKICNVCGHKGVPQQKVVVKLSLRDSSGEIPFVCCFEREAEKLLTLNGSDIALLEQQNNARNFLIIFFLN